MKDYEEEIMQKAIAGDAEAQYDLAWTCRYAHDDKAAVKWYRKAAEQGHTDALFWLGWMYSEGLGVTQDHEEAVRWFGRYTEMMETVR